MNLMGKGLVKFSMLGVAIPLAYFVANAVSGGGVNRIFMYRGMEEVLLALWPGAIFLIGTDSGADYFPKALSVASNILYYALVWCVFLLVRKLVSMKGRVD